MSKIKLINQEIELDLYVRHLHEHMSDSGKNGNIIYAPYLTGYEHDFEKMKENICQKIENDPPTIPWIKIFGLFSGEKIVGHIDLHGYPMETATHRCRLGMGIDKDFRGQGHGLALLSFVSRWLKKNTAIEWMDLYTFAHNDSAIALYKKFGFKEIGRVEDMFRIDGEKIKDLNMTFNLLS